jgi:hypothetical protein
MHAAWTKTAPFAVLTLAALTLTGCVVEPGPYYGGGYYAQPAPVYYGPQVYYGQRFYYGPRYHHHRWHRWHGGGWRGGGWHGGGHGGGWGGGHH